MTAKAPVSGIGRSTALLGAIFLVLVVGCATPPEVRRAETPAERLFMQGQHKMDRKDYQGAIEKFDRVRNDHPYSRYAVRADLRIADAYFAQDQWSSAAEQYRTFVKLHPKHERVAYARFRIGKAAYEQMPNDWFMLPPAHERDLTSTKKAARELQSFLDKHPKSKHVDEAKKLLARARRRLANHEMYVAKFYLERENPEGASYRLKYLLNNYTGLGLDAEALFLLAKSYLQMDDLKGAKTALKDLLKYHSGSEYAERARRYVDQYDIDLAADNGKEGEKGGGAEKGEGGEEKKGS